MSAAETLAMLAVDRELESLRARLTALEIAATLREGDLKRNEAEAAADWARGAPLTAQQWGLLHRLQCPESYRPWPARKAIA